MTGRKNKKRFILVLIKKILYTWLLCNLLILCWYYQSPATEKPNDQLQFSGINRVVIDPGFGGKDFGAPGYINGVNSKDVNLQIAKKLAKEIREKNRPGHYYDA